MYMYLILPLSNAIKSLCKNYQGIKHLLPFSILNAFGTLFNFQGMSVFSLKKRIVKTMRQKRETETTEERATHTYLHIHCINVSNKALHQPF